MGKFYDLQDDKMGVFLDWKMRFEIVLGIARGMLYLHHLDPWEFNDI